MNPTQGQLNSQNWINGQQAQNQPNFIEKILPTIGSIGGGILGSMVEPVGGTIAGSAGGSALGQELENALTGGHGSVGGAAASGAVGGIGGVGASKLLGGAAEALGGIASKNAAADAGAEFSKPFKSVFNSTVGKQNNVAENLPLMQSLGVEGTPRGVLNAGNAATGTDGLMTKAMNQIVTDSGQLPSNNIGNRVSVALQEGGVDPADKDVSWLMQKIRNITSSDTTMNGRVGGGAVTGTGSSSAQISEQVDPSGLFSTIQKLDKQISNYYKPNVELKVEDASKLQALQNVKGELENTLYGNGIDKAAADYTVSPEDAQALLKSTGGNTTLTDKIVTDINNAKSGQDMRSIQQPFVQSKNIARAAQFANQGKNTLIPEGSAVSGGKAVAPIVQNAANVTHPILGAGVGAVNAIGNKAVGPLAGILGSPGIAGGELGSATVPGAGGVLAQLLAHAPNANNDATAPSGAAGGIGAGAYQTSPVASLMANPAIAANLSFDPSAVVPLLQRAQQASSAQSQLGSLESAYNKAGGGQGFGSGILAKLSSMIPGTQAYQYEQEKSALAQALAAVTGGNTQSILAALPSLMSDQSGAQNMFTGLQGQISAAGSIPQ